MSGILPWMQDNLLPQLTLSRLAGYAADARLGPLTTAFIRWFIKQYQVDLSEAQHDAVTDYKTFNDFFTRALKPDTRTLELGPQQLICPVDGAISELGDIEHNQIIQAKGHQYTLDAFLAKDYAKAQQFHDGKFATLYLSPRDYHRVHIPCDGELRSMTHVPGKLYSVNNDSVSRVPGLFAKNERLICYFDTAFGPMAYVMVGATIVGSIETVWSGVVTPPRSKSVRSWEYEPGQIQLKQGDELGRFRLGSTVILLFPKDCMAFDASFCRQPQIQLGQTMGSLIQP
tara:strand:+ start:492 stop:1349 length:858 start_codon:yes stop_codon:yes gene_type:complete